MQINSLLLLKEAEKIILYGASTSGERAYFELLNYGVLPSKILFFDGNVKKQGGSFCGRKVLLSDDFLNYPKDVLIIITSVMFNEIKTFLNEKGFNNHHYINELVFSRKKLPKFNDHFNALIEKIPSRSMSDDEFYTLYSSGLAVKNVRGAIAELGVYKGGSAFLLASVSNNKNIYLFDTFSGLPESSTFKSGFAPKEEPSKGWLNDADASEVGKFVLTSGVRKEKVFIKVGIFPATTKGLESEFFSLVHLDTDLYESTFDALSFFYPRMTSGGRIISHDYNAIGCPGVKKAFVDYFEAMHRPYLLVEISESQVLIIKP